MLNLFSSKFNVLTSLDVFLADHGFDHLNVLGKGALSLAAPFIVVICKFVFTILTVVTCAKI